MIAKGWDKSFNNDQKLHTYLPLMHSENLDDQNQCLKLFEGTGGTEKFAKEHQVIIEKFGRFPHRNEVLGRQSTPEEVEFLKTHKGF